MGDARVYRKSKLTESETLRYAVFLQSFLFSVYVFACMYVYGSHECLVPGTGVTDHCKPPCGLWESNLGPLREQQPHICNSLY